MRLPSFSNATLRDIDPMPLLWGVLAIAAFQFGLGLYATALNELFYARFGPFFDSLSYWNQIADQAAVARERGRISALIEQVQPEHRLLSCAAVRAVLAHRGTFARSVGVWIQIFTAAWMQFLIFFYFLRVRARPWAIAFASSAVFSVIAIAFNHNGGFSDFRVDLLQYLTMAAVLAAYLIARNRDRMIWWVVLGCTIAVMCLARATSLVYLVPIFSILAATDLYSATDRKRVFVRWIAAGAVAIALASWFFVVNFEQLYFYYFVWNEDANARLPLARSVRHLKFAVEHIGTPLLLGIVFAALAMAALHIRERRRIALEFFHWRPLLFAIVPLGYLVLSGSGLNPFVSIVGVAGIVWFLLDPADDRTPAFPGWLSILIVTVLIAGGALNAASGIRKHTRDPAASTWLPRREGIRQIVDAMAEILRRDEHARTYRYATTYTSGLNRQVIYNVLVYDERLPALPRQAMVIGRSRLMPAERADTPATAVEGMRIANNPDLGFATEIVRRLNENTDFVVTSTEDSQLPPHVFVSRFVPEINRLLTASGQWERIAGPITISPTERAIVLRNQRRSGDPN